MRAEKVPKLKGTAIRLFSGLADSYDRTLDLATLMQDRRWKRWVVDRAHSGEGELLLDVGSGTLVLEEGLAKGKARVVGIDLSREMVIVGLKKRLGGVALVNADAEYLPFRDGAFDDIASCYVVKYVSTEKFAQELGRVIKPGGTLATYDFVKPRGPFSLLLALYVQGGLRLLGSLLSMAHRRSAFTFQNIGAIVEGADWDEQIAAAMQASGFETMALERLSGGVVCAYWGVKRAKDATPGRPVAREG